MSPSNPSETKFSILDGARSGCPEPTLLPHLAQHVAMQELGFLMDCAEVLSGGPSFHPWPRLVAATGKIVARRIDQQPNHPQAKKLLKTHRSLYDHLGLASLEVAIEVAETNEGEWSAEQRANRLWRLAARFPNYSNGLLQELAAAATLDLDDWHIDQNDAWLLALAAAEQRAAIIQRWLQKSHFDLEPAVALFANANSQEHAQLIPWLLKLNDQGMPNDLLVALLAASYPQMDATHQVQLRETLAQQLPVAIEQQTDWWVALAVSFAESIGLPVDLEKSYLPNEWKAWLKSYPQLDSGVDYADVLRAHLGITDPQQHPILIDAATNHAADLLNEMMGRWGGAEASMVGGATSAQPRMAEPPPVSPVPAAEEPAPANAAPPPARSSSGGGRESVPKPQSSSAGPESAPKGVIGSVAGALGGLLGGILGGRRSRDSEAPEATRGPIPEAAAEAASPTVPAAAAPRQLQADICLAAQAHNDNQGVLQHAFVAGKKHVLKVSVGRGASLQTGAAFDETIFADSPAAEAETLDLRFIYQEQVLAGTVTLPRDTALNSDAWTVEFVVPGDAQQVEATIVVLHKGRVLQAATVSGRVVASLESIDAENKISFALTPVHDFANLTQRAAFDASIVTDGKTGAAFAGASIGVRDLKGVDATIERMTNKLFKTSEAVTIAGQGGDPQLYEKLLVYLAANGKVLHSMLIRQLMPALDAAKRIQIVSTNPAGILPLEFVYSGVSPSHNATLCANWATALQAGHCEKCAQLTEEEQAARVCPVNFWALTKVIERHAPDVRRVDGHDFVVHTHNSGPRRKLAPLGRALFAASDNVPEDLVDSTLAQLRTVLRDVDDTRTWKNWAANVQTNSPGLLVSMPHNALDPIFEISTLEIGGGDGLPAGGVLPKHVCKEGAEVGPLVLLLGCQTATGKPQPFHTFVGEFRHCGASIVVGTLATVLAEHAAPIVQAIVRELTKASANNVSTVGDLLLGIRREMFTQGILISLAVAAFGDADWELAQPGETA